MRLAAAAILLRGCLPMPELPSPVERPVPLAEPPPPPPDTSWELALGRVWDEGHVVRGPERLAWTRDEALGAARALGADRDRYDAFAAWIVGPDVWDARRALPDGARRALGAALHDAVAWHRAYTLTWPIGVPHRVSSRFGPRIHPILGDLRVHQGIDLAVPVGTPVLAAQAGRVIVVRETSVSGRMVVIDHGSGLRTSYLHLDGWDVAVGDRVVRGQPIGRSGVTGRVTGPHLHFEVHAEGVNRDPGTFSRGASAATARGPRS